MTMCEPVYTLQDFTNITFGGFDIKLPDETLSIITELALQVGSPTYIKTPTFQKRDIKTMIPEKSIDNMDNGKKKRRGGNNRSNEDQDWEGLRTFQVTKLEQKVGINAQVDSIRYCLNTMTDKNYQKQSDEITDILKNVINDSNEEDILCIGNAIFEFASNNRFYSKLYADLYTKLIAQFDIMKQIFDTNFNSFLELFKTIIYIDSDKDYDGFCKMTSDNERRKSLSAFFVNLTINKIIPVDTLVELTSDLLRQVTILIKQENKKNEVDEIFENIAILYSKKTFDNYDKIVADDMPFTKLIEFLARCKVKMYPSLSNKTIFKCMDMVDM